METAYRNNLTRHKTCVNGGLFQNKHQSDNIWSQHFDIYIHFRIIVLDMIGVVKTLTNIYAYLDLMFFTFSNFCMFTTHAHVHILSN
jgi:hypothetical protein